MDGDRIKEIAERKLSSWVNVKTPCPAHKLSVLRVKVTGRHVSLYMLHLASVICHITDPQHFSLKKKSSISPPSSIPPLETLKKKDQSYTHILLKENPPCGITIMCSELCKNREQDVYYPREIRPIIHIHFT